MKKCLALVFIINFFSACYAAEALEGQLTHLRTLLQQLVTQLELEGSDIATFVSKIDQFVTKVAALPKPLLLIPLLLDQIGVTSAKIPKFTGAERTPEEMQIHQEIRADLSDLLEEIDRTKDAEKLRAQLGAKIEELYNKIPSEKPDQEPSHKALQEKITALLALIHNSEYPVEFFRIVLEELAELPVLPEREDGVPLDPQEEKNIRVQFASIMKEIMTLPDFVSVRENFVQQLKTAYSSAIAEAKQKEATKEAEQEEEIVIVPEIPTEPEKTPLELEQEEAYKELKEVLDVRREAIAGEYEGDDEDDEDEDFDEDLEYFPW